MTWEEDGDIIGRLFDSNGTTLLNTVNAADTMISGGGIAFRGTGGTKHFDTAVTPRNSDLYELTQVPPGQLELEVSRPAGADGHFSNQLNPKVILYDASGTLLSADGDSGVPRDAALTYVIPEAGSTYYVEVLASDAAGLTPSRGEYVFSASVTPLSDIVLSKSFIRTTESGGSDTFTVRLAEQPTGSVDINLIVSNEFEGTVTPASLVFTSDDWNLPQEVTVTGVNDDVADGNVQYSITLSATSADSRYHELTQIVSATNLDDDVVGIDLNVTAITMQEGTMSTFAVVLHSQPVGNVILEISSDAPWQGVVSSGGQESAGTISLTFTSGNWGTPQIITVSSLDNTINEGRANYTITVKAISGDPLYQSLSPQVVSVLDIDDDLPAAPWSVVDDFDDGNKSEYKDKFTGVPSNTSVTAEAARDGAYGLQQGGDTGLQGWLIRTDTPAQVQPGQTISVYVNSQGTAVAGEDWSRAYFGFGAGSKGAYAIIMGVNTGQFLLQKVTQSYYTYEDLAKAPQVWERDHWYRMEVEWRTGTTGDNLVGRLYDLAVVDGALTERLLNTISAKDTTYRSGGIAFRAFSSNKYFVTVMRKPTTSGSAANALASISGSGA